MGTEQGDPDRAVGRDLDAVGPGAPGRHGQDLHRALRYVEEADGIGLLAGEPDIAMRVPDQGMRIAGRILGRVDVLEGAGFDIVAADMGVAIAGIPDVPVGGDDEIVRPGTLAQVDALHLAGRDVEAGDVGILLPHEPDGLAVQRVGIARPALPGHIPFLDLDRGGLGTGEIRAGIAGRAWSRRRFPPESPCPARMFPARSRNRQRSPGWRA